MLNVSIPPSCETKNTTWSKPINDTTITFCPRLAELAVVPSTPFTNTPEEKLKQHVPTLTETSSKKDEHSNSKQLVPGEHIWWGVNPENPTWLGYTFHRFSGSEEYEILQKHIPGDVFSLKLLRTGETFKVRLPENL